MRNRPTWGAGMTVALLAAGCAPAPTASPSLSTPAPATDAASATPTASASASVSPGVSPAAAGVVLSGLGVAGYGFGSDAALLEPVLTARLGAPTVNESTGCEFNPLWTRSLRWQGLFVSFEAAGPAVTPDVTLATWHLRPAQGVPAGVSLAGGLPLTPTFAELAAAHPDTVVEEELGLFLFELPSGVTYIGENAPAPCEVRGGPIVWCE